MERKLLEGELKRRESQERYYLRQRRELIERIKGLQEGNSNGFEEQQHTP